MVGPYFFKTSSAPPSHIPFRPPENRGTDNTTLDGNGACGINRQVHFRRFSIFWSYRRILHFEAMVETSICGYLQGESFQGFVTVPQFTRPGGVAPSALLQRPGVLGGETQRRQSVGGSRRRAARLFKPSAPATCGGATVGGASQVFSLFWGTGGFVCSRAVTSRFVRFVVVV